MNVPTVQRPPMSESDFAAKIEWEGGIYRCARLWPQSRALRTGRTPRRMGQSRREMGSRTTRDRYRARDLESVSRRGLKAGTNPLLTTSYNLFYALSRYATLIHKFIPGR